MSDGPLPDGDNGGRDANGRFAPGNRYGRNGSPYAARIAAWRQQLFDAVTDEDIQAVARELVDAARKGKPWAIREVLNRCVGHAPAADLVEAMLKSAEVRERLDESEQWPFGPSWPSTPPEPPNCG